MSRRLTAQESVLAALHADIRTGELRPGDQIVQESLADRYGVSRVPLREALKTLEAEGLVEHHPHRGYFLVEMSVDDLAEVYSLRELLEAEALRQAVPLLSDVDIEVISEILDEVESAARAADVVSMAEANRRFHFAIFDAAGMPRLSRLLRQLWEATDAYRALYYEDPGNRDRVQHEHRAMIAALRARDAQELIRQQDSHRARTVDSVRARLVPEPY